MLKIILLFLVISLILSYILVTPIVVYIIILVRTKKEKWGRSCSLPEDKEYLRMHKKGIKWSNYHASVKTPVSIKNGRYNLAGEYFDFGFDQAVIIIPGRMESCIYSYYYAEPYRESGYNVLVIDNRSHGLSDGMVCSLGYKENEDIIAWSEYLHDSKNCRKVILHGICIGSSTALFALVNEKCPNYIQAIVADGMYVNFYESFRNHMIDQKRPMFLTINVIMLIIRLVSKANVVTDGPIYRIDKLEKPILFLHSKDDIYSVPEYAQKLYDKCRCRKEIVWFDRGAHSRLRVNNPKKYDDAIIKFCSTLP